MSRIFHIYVSNGPDQYAELDLPASGHKLLDIMDRLCLEPGKLPYLEILGCREEYSCLEQCIQELPDIFQLNALAEKLSEFSTIAHMAAFEGLVGLEISKGAPPVPLSRLIDFAYSADCFHVAADVVTDYELGRFLAESEYVPEVEGLSDAAFELLNFAKIGRERREAEGGIFTGFGYVEQHKALVKVYQTLNLTPKAPDYAMLLEVSKGFFNGPVYDSDKTVRLKLPASPEALSSALEAVEAWDWREVGWSCLDCRVPALTDMISDSEEGINFLNCLARRLADMEPKTLSAYKALLEVMDCKDIQSAETLMDSLDQYIFSPQYRSPVAMAKGKLSIILCRQEAELIEPYVNLYQYGQKLIQMCGGALTSYGLIERKDGQPVQTAMKSPVQGGLEMK